MPRIIAMLPTYNEAENIGPLLDAVLAAHPDMEALVVDDDSPDGTWHIVAKRAAAEPRIHLLHRTRDRGRGLAGVAGFRHALELGAGFVLEMDADWSHDPKWIPALIEASESGVDIVIGSRRVPGGGEAGRNWLRPLITRAANTYIRFMLRLPLRDATSGYRLFSRRCLEALPWEAIRAEGPAVLQEMQLAATARGFTTVEIPIQFMERRHGESTFNMKILWRSLTTMARLRLDPGELAPPQPLIGGKLSRDAARRERLTAMPMALAIPASWCYGLGRRLDRLWKLHGPRPPRKLSAPVVCVGNLTVGGTGKTPFVRMLSAELTAMGRQPAIVSRGYGAARRAPERPVVVSDRERVVAGVGEAGDEPLLLAEACAGTPVVIHPDRAQAGRLAVKLFDADIVVLDDGFQHDALRRELDIVLWDLRDEPARARQLPAGRLREGLGALCRAGAIVLTHREYLTHFDREGLSAWIERVVAQLKRAAPGVPVFEAVMSVTEAERLGGGEPDGSRRDWPWSGERVVAVSGLARPGGFETMLAETGAEVRQHMAYPDHHAYTQDQVARWAQALETAQASMIVTTAKDAVKLKALDLGALPVVAMHIEMRMTELERWREFLAQRLGN